MDSQWGCMSLTHRVRLPESPESAQNHRFTAHNASALYHTRYAIWEIWVCWYIHSFLWGRYASSTELALNQDLALIEESDGGIERLIAQLRQIRGDLTLHPNDFIGWSRGARFCPLLYVMTRVCKARDLDTGNKPSIHLLGKFCQLQLHHIFPKSVLYKHGYSRPEVNGLANFTFLTQETNLLVTNRLSEEYLPEFIEKHPGSVESHWIPMHKELWKVENYPDFLAARMELLASGANEFLASLLAGAEPEAGAPVTLLDRIAAQVPGGVESEEEEREVMECNQWLVEHGLPEGDYMYELVDERTGEPTAILDLAWPAGLQQGYSQPVALLIGERSETFTAANRAGFRCFAEKDSFRSYVEREILAADSSAADGES